MDRPFPSLVPLLRFVYDHMYTRTTPRLSLNASSPQARQTEATLKLQSGDEERGESKRDVKRVYAEPLKTEGQEEALSAHNITEGIRNRAVAALWKASTPAQVGLRMAYVK
ncbi:unnamed protein product [Leuciscus chuanchicus]